MTYKNYNVARPRKVQQQNGEEKTFWDNVGRITLFTNEDGKESGKLELYSFASRTIELNVFPQLKKEVENKQKENTINVPEEDDEEIRVENIPF